MSLIYGVSQASSDSTAYPSAIAKSVRSLGDKCRYVEMVVEDRFGAIASRLGDKHHGKNAGVLLESLVDILSSNNE